MKVEKLASLREKGGPVTGMPVNEVARWPSSRAKSICPPDEKWGAT